MTAAITDFTQYAALRRAAEANDRDALRQVAGQFEALFLESLLKNMRAAPAGDSPFGDSDAHDMYRGLLDQQLALEMARGRGMGLAEMLVRQLGGEDAAALPNERAFDPVRVTRPAAAAGVPAWTSPERFAQDVWPYATRVAARLNVAPEGVLAQAALETGWGRHVMQRSDGASSFNLFGIKAGRSWAGDSVSRRTIEFEGGAARQTVARFRAYDDVGATFDDYARLLGTNPNFARVRDHGSDVEGFASALQSSGYATDPQYAAKISAVANGDTMSRVLSALKSAAEAPIAR